MTADHDLTTADMEILAFERTEFRGKSGPKESAILARFGDMSTRYYQRLAAILRKPGAMAYDPELVSRLNRLRVARAEQRSPRTRGTA